MALREVLAVVAGGPQTTSSLDDLLITWLDKPITDLAIDLAAVLFNDYNDIHMDEAAAKRSFGTKATGRVAHGMLVLGQIGGAIGRYYGKGTQAREITDVKFSQPFCPGDLPGYRIKVIHRRKKLGLTYIVAEVVIFRQRDGQVMLATENKVMKFEVVYPTSNEGLNKSSAFV